MDYREHIRERMTELGWSQAALAVASGVNPATLSRFFNGKQELDVPQLTAVARAMNVEPGDMLPHSKTHPMLQRLTPIVEQLSALHIEDQMRAISALESSLTAMRGWRSGINSTLPSRPSYNATSGSAQTDGSAGGTEVGAGSVNDNAHDPPTSTATEAHALARKRAKGTRR